MLANHNFSEEILESNDEMVKFYTGLPSYSILKTVFEFCAPQISRGTKLTQFQEMMLTFVKLRLNPSHKDLAYRFDLSVSTDNGLTVRVCGRRCLSVFVRILEKVLLS